MAEGRPCVCAVGPDGTQSTTPSRLHLQPSVSPAPPSCHPGVSPLMGFCVFTVFLCSPTSFTHLLSAVGRPSDLTQKAWRSSPPPCSSWTPSLFSLPLCSGFRRQGGFPRVQVFCSPISLPSAPAPLAHGSRCVPLHCSDGLSPASHSAAHAPTCVCWSSSSAGQSCSCFA